MKKVFSMLLCLFMLIGVFPTMSFSAGVKNVPIIILRMDDYTARSRAIEEFEKTFEILREEDVKATFGIIGSLAEVNEQEKITAENVELFWKKTNEYLDYGIQFWHHGYTHGGYEFSGGLTYDEAKANFKKTMDLFYENTGEKLTSFGGPGNRLNDECFQMIDTEFPEIRTVFKSTSLTDSTSADITYLDNMMYVETDGELDYDKFLTSYSSLAGEDCAFMFIHPSGFSDAERETLRKIIRFLKSKGTAIMTSEEYAEHKAFNVNNVSVNGNRDVTYTIGGSDLVKDSTVLYTEIKDSEGTVLSTETFTYDGSNRRKIAIDNIEAKSVGGEYTISVSIMNDSTKVKTSTLDYVEAITYDAPIIILKLDDFHDGNAHKFKPFIQMANEENVPVSLGAIVGWSAESRADFWDLIKEWTDEGHELWCHGWNHNSDEKGSEFAGTHTYDEMKESMRLCLDRVKRMTDYDMTCFGAPGNNISDTCVEMINKEFPQIETVFFNTRASIPINAVEMNYRFNTVDGASFTVENFKDTYNPDAECAVIQLHPSNFTGTDSDGTAYDYTENFRSVIRYFKDEGCTFMTPSQYAAYKRGRFEADAAKLTNLKSGNITFSVGASEKKIIIFSLCDKDGVLKKVKYVANPLYSNRILTASIDLSGHTVENGDKLSAYIWSANSSLIPARESVSISTYKYDIIFESVRGTVPKGEAYEKGTTIVLPDMDNVESYSFDGWKKNGEGELIAPGTEYEVTDNAIFVAQWIEAFAVEFKNADGTTVLEDIRAQNGDVITLPSVEDDPESGLKFEGWKLNNEGELLLSGTSYGPVTSNKTFVAQWKKFWTGKVATDAPETQTGADGKLYYLIEDCDDLAWFANYVNTVDASANAVLCNDIYLNAQTGDLIAYTNNWNNYRIGSSDAPYAGTFDGNGKSIYGLYIAPTSKQGTYTGMFNQVSGATIKNLKLQAPYMVSYVTSDSSKYTGILIGGMTGNASTIDDVDIIGGKFTANANSTNVHSFGSIAGTITTPAGETKVANCDSSITLDTPTTAQYTYTSTNGGIGGIIGRAMGDSEKTIVIDNCSFTGHINVPGTSAVGAIIGRGAGTSSKKSYVTIKNCFGEFTATTTTNPIAGISANYTDGSNNTISQKAKS